jgi:hypothetical protein
MKLSRTQVLVYAKTVGLPSIFADIAMAESSGETTVVNSIGCVGLWQINQPVHVKAHPTWTREWLKDPMHNAIAARALYDANGLKPWDSSKAKWSQSPQYKALRLVTENPVIDAAQTVTSGAENIASGLSTVASGVQRSASWVSTPYNWVRVAEVVGGMALVLVGVGMMVYMPAVNAATSYVAGKTKAALGGGAK